MGIGKKIILGIILLAGLFGLASDFHQYGEIAGMLLAIEFMFTTIFLWAWASGNFPSIGKTGATVILLISALVMLAIINWALSDELHVDMIEVIRTTLQHKPIYYAEVLIASFLKVFLWSWLFSGVREERADAAVSA